ncbi:shikimate dehydrogenase [Ciceribacter sp. L1K22]|uniref:shikimate dehydrogenase n=1 Tax=Ciceribacter sp. L1K22 TaxID=2820275 RepID=UPI001ABE5A6B|nr:shikimate dehydrogenase [Ciceribacter sp. L1K22]MBO3758274.1 shikimate dehydrogenase [Ciceribacter sp. L1K22]
MRDSRETQLIRAFILGFPVKHSRSPLIHNYWIRQLGLHGVYEKIEVAPENIRAFFDRLRSSESGFVGGNVTIPHKEAAAAYADHCDDVVREIGAANVLWLENGRLYASNTDAAGFLACLDEEAPGWDKTQRAVVMGAGGASRSVVYALRQRGLSEIHVVNRTLDRAQELVDRFGAKVHAHQMDSIGEVIAGAGLFVNTTSLGMGGSNVPELPFDRMASNGVVNDIIYTPRLTPILMQAARAGRVSVGGLGMLLHQAVPGFEKWFGQRPEITDTLRQMIISDVDRET